MELVVKESYYSWASFAIDGEYIYGQAESPYSCYLTKYPLSRLVGSSFKLYGITPVKVNNIAIADIQKINGV
jgi:hypothetical protein